MLNLYMHQQQKIASTTDLLQMTMQKLGIQASVMFIAAMFTNLPIIRPIAPLLTIIALIAFVISSIRMQWIVRSIYNNIYRDNTYDASNNLNFDKIAKFSSSIRNMSYIIALSIGVMLGLHLSFVNYRILSITFILFAIAVSIIAYIVRNDSIQINRYDLSKAMYVLCGLSILFIIASFFVYMQWLEVIICAIAIPTFIGVSAYKIKMITNRNAIPGNMSKKALNALSTYAASEILVDLYTIFIYILRLVQIFSGSNNRRNH